MIIIMIIVVVIITIIIVIGRGVTWAALRGAGVGPLRAHSLPVSC